MEEVEYKDEEIQEKEKSSVDDIVSATYESAFQKNDKICANNSNIIPSSLLTLLDDKNKSIVLLKRQIHNQKLQLEFYLHKVLRNQKINDFADTCIPYEAEENLQINLAMTKFCQQTGLQSRIMNLHQRMICVEQRLTTLLPQQEEMVHEIVTKIADCARKGSESNPAEIFCKFISDDGQVDILAKILGSTNKLRKELDYFRTSCNRLVFIEEERNSLVDKVYSMPAAQRLSYGVILAANYEKMRLEKEVNEIKEEQKMLQERLSHLPSVLDTFNDNFAPVTADQTNVSKMLETVNTEAVSLLAIAKDQKEKYMEEINKLKKSNSMLGQEINSMHQIKMAKDELEGHLAEANVELEKVKEQNKTDFNELRVKLQAVMEEREFLQNKLQYYYDLEEQLQFMKSNAEDVETIKRQRDYYKAQVEDLQAIRAAYAQLVEHCPVKSDDHPEQLEQMLSKIQGVVLENQKELMTTEVKTMGEIITDQEIQIKHLLIIIKEMAERPDFKRTTDTSATQTQIKADIVGLRYSENAKGCGEVANFGKDSGFTSENKSAYSQADDESHLRSVLRQMQSFSEESALKHISSDEYSEQVVNTTLIPCSSTSEQPITTGSSDEFSENTLIKRPKSATRDVRRNLEQPIVVGSSDECVETTPYKRPVTRSSDDGNEKPSKLPISVRSEKKPSQRSLGKSLRPTSAKSRDLCDSQLFSPTPLCEYTENSTLPSTSTDFSPQIQHPLRKDKIVFASTSNEYVENVVYSKTTRKPTKIRSQASYSYSTSCLQIPNEDGVQSLNSWKSAKVCSCSNCPMDTSVEIKTINQKGQSESMKAIFKTSQPVESIIQMNESFSLRVTCGPVNKSVMSKTVATLAPILSEQELRNTYLSVDSPTTIDEYELMKDSSNETMVVTLPSLHKHVGKISIQCMGYKRQVKETPVGSSTNLVEAQLRASLETKVCLKSDRCEESEANESGSEDEQIFSRFASDNEQIVGDGGEVRKEISITTRLKKITSEIGYTLSQPGGKETLLSAVKAMYGNLFTENYSQQVGHYK